MATILAPLLGVIVIASMILLVSALAIDWFLPVQYGVLAAMTGFFVICRWLVQLGHLRAAAHGTTVVAMAASTSSLYLDPTPSTFGVAFAVAIAVGGLVLGRRSALWLAMIASALIIGVNLLQQGGLIELRRAPEPLAVAITQATCLIVLGGAMSWANRALGRALEQVRLEEERARELEQGLFQAQRMESIGRLAGGIAHDFNNLLTVAVGNASYLRATATLTDDQSDAVDAILKACGGGAGLTKQLLTFGRMRVVAPEVLDPSTVIDDFRLVLEHMAGKRARLTIRCPRGGATFECDPGQLQHALANLVINASNAIDDGGTIDIESESITLAAPRVTAHGAIPAGDYVVVRVRDNGSGMSPEVIAAAFDPFFTTRRGAGGSGLGLAVVHGVLQQTGGFTEIESEVGRGTTVSLWFRQSQADATWTPAGDGSIAPTRLEGLEVLVVDDDHDARRGIELMLAGIGANSRAFASGAEALAYLDETAVPPTIALLDVLMPEMPGTVLAKAMRERGFRGRIVFLTGYADPDSLREEVLHEATVLYKPAGSPDLARALTAALAQAPADEG